MKLNDLPVEILTIIVRMARDQDARLKTRLVQARPCEATPTKEVMKLFAKYGSSLSALRATCKTLETIANPFVFESVRLHQSDHNIFFDTIIPKYSSFVRSAVMDCSPHSSYSAGESVTEFLMALQELPAVYRLSIETAKSAETFRTLHLNAHSASTEMGSSSSRRYLRPLLATLSARITHLVCLEGTPSQMEFFIKHFPNLQSIKRRLYRQEEENSQNKECESYSSLERLEELDISTISFQDEQTIRRPKSPPKSYKWSERWLSQTWSTVRTLNLSFKTLTSDDWTLLQNFRLSLQQLSLCGTRIEKTLLESDVDVDAVDFPNLSTLKMTGDRHLVSTFLRLLKLAPLSILEVKLAGGSSIEPFNVQPRIDYLIHENLLHFGSTLKILKWDTFNIYHGPRFTFQMEIFAAANGIAFSLGKPDESQLFLDFAQFTNKDSNASAAPQASTEPSSIPSYASQSYYAKIEEVVDYAADCAFAAMMRDDPDTLNRISTLLRPLAALLVMDRE